MKAYLPISSVVLAFIGLALLYSAAAPVGEGPDEPGHGQYVLFLARERRLPVQCAAPCQSDVPGSGHHPPLAYLLAAPLVSWLPPEERRLDIPGNRRFVWAGGDQPSALAHGTRERWPWAPLVVAWRLARLASTAAGAAAVVLTYLAARALTEGRASAASAHARARRAVPLLAAALLALNPQFIFTSALISNDALLAALGAALLWLVVDREPRTKNQEPETRRAADALGRAALVGLVLGLALLTKASAIVLAPVALGWALLGPRTADRGPRTVDERPERAGTSRFTRPLRSSVLGLRSLRLTVVLGVAAAVAGWWYARNWRLYGDPLGLDLFRGEFVTQPFDPLSVAAWAQALAQLYASSWARFGWLTVAPPAWVDWAYAALGLAALAGLARRAAHGARTQNAEPRTLGLARAWPLLALPALALAWVLSFALTAGLVAWQGRLLFPAAAAIAALLAQGLVSIQYAVVSTQRTSLMSWRAGYWLLAPGFFALALWLPFGVIRPAYPTLALTEAEALAGLGTPAYGRFARTDEPGAELRGWSLAGEARPGQALALETTWRALGPQNRDWWAFVHLVDASGEIAAETNAEVGGGVFPMLQWRAGDWMRDRQTLELPPGIAPGAYELRLGLWYPETGRRARVYADGGTLLGDQLTLTTVTVGP